MPRLSTFIRENTEEILAEWETFARSLPMGDSMDVVALRDHAKEMLGVIARDLDTPQTRRQQVDKSKGKRDAPERTAPTAAQEHGAGRAESGFTVAQMVSEFRALRSSVMHLWTRKQAEVGITDIQDMIRFNEGIDQAIAESVTRHTHEIGQSKERFLAILGHDLRTPLSAIITSTRFMLDTDELREPYLTLVTRVASSARRMNQMVADLLEFTRTRFGDSIPIVRAETDVRKIVHDVVAEVAATYPSTTLQIETTGQLVGQWDPDRLTQALTNLVGNAVHHGSEGSPIKVAARGEPTEVVILVQNQGPVIPKKQLGQIFGAMKHVTDDGARDRRHLGLGLYIVDKIVAAHGGAIDVRSSKERGTTFTVHLPRSV
ncbi:MAG: sensor histidine kinase [Gemmatimonadota bacterium]|nr:sensor histidine kinase [Gemmatimonadota bacterium]